MSCPWSDSLSRLESIRSVDTGLYGVALHAFIEHEAQAVLGSTRDMNFREILQSWWRDHREVLAPGLSGDEEDDLLAVLHAVIRDHGLTNTVRHNFARLGGEDERGLTWNFLRLGRYAGWAENPAAAPLRQSLESWDQRASAADDAVLRDLKADFADLQARSAELLADRPVLEAKEAEIRALKAALFQAETAGGPGGGVGVAAPGGGPDGGMGAAPSTAPGAGPTGRPADAPGDAPDAGAAPGSADPAELRRRIRVLRSEIETSDYRRYLAGLGRFSLAARSRRDFEKHLVRLTPEQQAALADFSADRDLLITGGAGTGKTLVLLEALSRTLKDRPPELNLGQPTSTTLVTFTKTLVKYDRYLAALMAPGRVQEADLQSSETFFWSKLKLKEPHHQVDYGWLRSAMPEVNSTGVLSDAELYIEIEEFLFGLDIRREEYLDAAVPRKGLKTPLNLAEREAVWTIREALAERMTAEGRYSKHFARLRLLHWLRSDDEGLRSHEHLFVDESQDMAAVELMCLKELAGRSLIMAGDSGQSIYGFINPYRRANLELDQEQIRLLVTNHRNTIPIHALAEGFRRSGLGPGEDPGPESYPFREGPEPETHVMDNPDALADLAAAKARMYIRDVGYDADAVGILCSRTAHLAMMAEKLAAVGLDSSVVKGEAFDFAQRGVVRLSTLHSSKGLDFPVVLMYVPELPPAREIDPPYQDRLYRNLQYVAMSRGMDVVERFELKTLL